MLRRPHPVRTTRVSALCSSADPTTFSTVPFNGPLTRKPSHCASQYRATGLDLSNRLSVRAWTVIVTPGTSCIQRHLQRLLRWSLAAHQAAGAWPPDVVISGRRFELLGRPRRSIGSFNPDKIDMVSGSTLKAQTSALSGGTNFSGA